MTTKEEISGWFDRGIREGATHLVVVCDTFDWDDYPVFCNNDDEVRKRVYSPGEMQKVMEVYDLRQSKAEQMNEHRSWRVPK